MRFDTVIKIWNVALDQRIIRGPLDQRTKPARLINGQTDAVNHLMLDFFKPLVVNFHHDYILIHARTILSFKKIK